MGLDTAKKKTGPFGDINDREAKPIDNHTTHTKTDAFGLTTSTTKEKKKKSLWDPEVPEEKGDLIGASDPWGFSASKKHEIPEPAPDPPPAASPLDDWFGASKGKKKKAGGMFGDPSPELEKKEDPTWDAWASGKKDKIPDPVPDPPPEDLWGGGWGSTKKDKKKKSSPWEDPDPPVSNDKKDDDDFWGSLGTGKKTKKKAAGDLISLDAEIPPPAPDPIEATGDDDFFSSWGTGKKDKKKSDGSAWKPDSIEEPKDSFWGSKSHENPVEIVDDPIGKFPRLSDMEGQIRQDGSIYEHTKLS